MDDLTPDILQRLYVEEGLTEKEIASLYETYQVKINRLRRNYGIPTVLKSERLDLPAFTTIQMPIGRVGKEARFEPLCLFARPAR